MSIIVFQLIGSKNTNAIGMKGRNVCNFFIFFNFAMWLTYTFERQSANSSAFESQVLGTVAWAIIQRMTLPMIIFFRFHALVFCVELEKQYSGNDSHKDHTRLTSFGWLGCLGHLINPNRPQGDTTQTGNEDHSIMI